MIDDHSRLCLDTHALRVFKGHDVDHRFRRTADTYGNPASLLTDNGAVFTGRSHGRGRVALEVTLNARGSALGTHGLITHKPAARWSGSTNTEEMACPNNRQRGRCGSFKPSSTPSAATTTPSDRTAPSNDAPPPTPTQPAR